MQVVVVGRRGDTATDGLLRSVWRTGLPGRTVKVIAPGVALPVRHPAYGKGQIDDKPTAYVCTGTFCSLPVTEAPAFAAALKRVRMVRAATAPPSAATR